MVKVKFSTSYAAKMARIRRLPKLIEAMLETSSKKDALGVIKEFQDGIRNNSLGLEPLRESTIEKKESQGLEKPETPLYGWGDEIDLKTYINMLRVRRLKNGYRVTPSRARHHKSELSLKDLFNVHEYGAIIEVGKENPRLIRIPPRPAFFLAFKNYMRKKEKQENTARVRKAIREYVEQGKTATIKAILKKGQDFNKYDE